MKEFNTVALLDSKIINEAQLLIDSGKLLDALDFIFKIMIALVGNGQLKNKFNQLPQLDALVQSIGLKVFDEIKNNNKNIRIKDGEINLFLASEIYLTGGHTRLIEDLTSSTHSANILVLTDLFDRYSTGNLFVDQLSNKINAPIVILPQGDKLSKLINLQKLILTLGVRSINIMAHHHDVISYAACIENLNIPQYYYHHADHNPTLGATIAHYCHYDFFISNMVMCNKAGYVNPLYMPLSSPSRFYENDSFDIINTATSGTANKFTFDDVDIKYTRVVSSILKSINGNHFHIGPLSEEHINEIKDQLRNDNIDENRFIYMGAVSGIQDIIHKHNINIYITSAPVGGGKAFIDILGTGICIFVYKDPNLEKSQEIILKLANLYNYNSSIIRWMTTKDLSEKIKSTNFLEYRSTLRCFYHEYHAEEKFLNLCRNILGN
jgi:hypothetical protein